MFVVRHYRRCLLQGNHNKRQASASTLLIKQVQIKVNFYTLVQLQVVQCEKKRNFHTMEYLQQIYAKLFGDWSSEEDNTPRKVVAFGNVLLDRTAQIEDNTLLERHQLQPNTKGELDAETLAKITAEACESINCNVNPGGSALNTVRILKALGTDALFFGAVGEDKHAEELKDILKQRGVQARLQTVPDVPTGQCICLINEDNATLYANIGASAKFSTHYLQQQANDDTKTFLRPIVRKQVLYIEGFFVPQRADVCEFIVKNYIRERRRLALNLSASYIVEQNFEQIKSLAMEAFFIFGNRNEFDSLMKQMQVNSMDKMAKALLANGAVKIIVITKGAQGVEIISNFVEEHAEAGSIAFECFHPPHVEEVVDATGAGDAFVAGFLHAWLEKRALSECVRVASDVAAKVVTQIGCNLP